MAKKRQEDDRLPKTGPNYVLYAHIDTRRQELRMTWDDVADAARVSDSTLFGLRAEAIKPRVRTLTGIDTAMEWEPGSARDILKGKEPTPLIIAPQPSLAEILDDLADVRDQLRTALDVVEARIHKIEGQR